MLRLPDLDQAKSAVLNTLRSADAQRGYSHAIEEFIDWYCSKPRLSFSKSVVLRYRIHLESRGLEPGTINLRLGAVRRLAYEASHCGLLIPALVAGIRRVKGVKKIGVRLGNWLTPEQSLRLWRAPDIEQLKGKRDRALLAVLTQLRYDLRKMRAHGLLERDGRRYRYRLTDKGRKVALLFILFHKRVCGPLANSLFHHPIGPNHAPNSKLEQAYHRADRAIQQVIDLLAP